MEEGAGDWVWRVWEKRIEGAAQAPGLSDRMDKAYEEVGRLH